MSHASFLFKALSVSTKSDVALKLSCIFMRLFRHLQSFGASILLFTWLWSAIDHAGTAVMLPRQVGHHPWTSRPLQSMVDESMYIDDTIQPCLSRLTVQFLWCGQKSIPWPWAARMGIKLGKDYCTPEHAQRTPVHIMTEEIQAPLVGPFPPEEFPAEEPPPEEFLPEEFSLEGLSTEDFSLEDFSLTGYP